MSKQTADKIKTDNTSEQLKTEPPLSEKDEVKKAEDRTAQQQEKAKSFRADKK